MGSLGLISTVRSGGGRRLPWIQASQTPCAPLVDVQGDTSTEGAMRRRACQVDRAVSGTRLAGSAGAQLSVRRRHRRCLDCASCCSMAAAL